MNILSKWSHCHYYFRNIIVVLYSTAALEEKRKESMLFWECSVLVSNQWLHMHSKILSCATNIFIGCTGVHAGIERIGIYKYF